jgi:hypothetical protein
MVATKRVKAATPVVDRLLTNAIGGTTSSADGAGSSPQPAATPA